MEQLKPSKKAFSGGIEDSIKQHSSLIAQEKKQNQFYLRAGIKFKTLSYTRASSMFSLSSHFGLLSKPISIRKSSLLLAQFHNPKSYEFSVPHYQISYLRQKQWAESQSLQSHRFAQHPDTAIHQKQVVFNVDKLSQNSITGCVGQTTTKLAESQQQQEQIPIDIDALSTAQQDPNSPTQQEQHLSQFSALFKNLKLRDFLELTKFKLSLMNTFVALPTYLYLAEEISPTAITLALATQLMAMSSQTFNQIMEAKYDKLMTRTQRRPLASGILSPFPAKILGCTLYALSNAIFFSCFPISTGLVANAIFLSYIGIYTPLKRITTFNTPVGAVVGALTPYIGYTAAGGSIFDLYPMYYSIYMTFWQFQHFYGIAWIYKNDYIKAGFKMCQNKNEAVGYMAGSFLLNVAGNCAFFFMNPYSVTLSAVYASIMTATYFQTFIRPAWAFYKDPNVNTAKSMRAMSYFHLMVFFSIIILDTFFHIHENRCKKSINEDGTIKSINQEKLIGKAHMIFAKMEEEKQDESKIQDISGKLKK